MDNTPPPSARLRPALTMAAFAVLAACGEAPPSIPLAGAPLPQLETPQRHLLATTNLTIATLSVDSTASGYDAPRMKDLNLATQWSNGGYANATSWAVAGLSASVGLAGVTLKTPPSTGTFDLQVSGTGTSWTTVRSGLTNTTWNLEFKSFPAGTTGRYVRVFWHNRTTSPFPHFQIYELSLQGGTASSSPTPTPTVTPTPVPSASSSSTLICPTSTTCYPQGTVFITGNSKVTVGVGGVFTPNHQYVRPGASTTFTNIDKVYHTVTGFNGATSDSGPIPPGGSYTHTWQHAGTWYFHDRLTTNPPTYAVTDVPY